MDLQCGHDRRCADSSAGPGFLGAWIVGFFRFVRELGFERQLRFKRLVGELGIEWRTSPSSLPPQPLLERLVFVGQLRFFEQLRFERRLHCIVWQLRFVR